jgi:hypothetical protein
MTILTDYRTAILNLLSDDGTRFDNDTLDQGLRLALMEYVQYSPDIIQVEFTVTTAGRDQDISAITGYEKSLQICYPYTTGQDTPTEVEAYYEYKSAGGPLIHFQGNIIPQVGEKLLILYTAFHTIEDLDSAAVTSVPDIHKTILVSGAAGHAGIIRVSQIGEAYTTQSGSKIFISEWAKKELATFRYLLRNIRQGQSGLTSLNSGAYWNLDQWDT